MLKIPIVVIVCFFSVSAFAQMSVRLELKEDVAGICDKNNVYSLYARFGEQSEALCAVSKEEILARLNIMPPYLKEHPKYKAKVVVSLLINCKGEVVRTKIDKTASPELDTYIESVINSLRSWKPGILAGKEVDSSQLLIFKIKKGVFRT